MREIKFRAWETTLKEMIPVFNIDFEKKLINTNGAWRTFGEVELMQYTCLRDINGIDIYEGDIILMNCGTYTDVEKIHFSHGAFRFSNSDNLTYEHDMRVIGNIYQHPHRLEMKE